MGAIGDDEDLHIFKQAACRPEAFTLVALDLVEGFPDGDAPSLQLHMYQRKAIHENGDIVARLMLPLRFLKLVDDLEVVIVNVLFVEEVDVLGGTVIALENLDMVGLDFAGLFDDTLVLTGKVVGEKPVPFVFGKGIAIEQFQLMAQIGDELFFVMNGQVGIALGLKLLDESLLQLCLALVSVSGRILRYIF